MYLNMYTLKIILSLYKIYTTHLCVDTIIITYNC